VAESSRVNLTNNIFLHKFLHVNFLGNLCVFSSVNSMNFVKFREINRQFFENSVRQQHQRFFFGNM
jgi:hypothetical protein